MTIFDLPNTEEEAVKFTKHIKMGTVIFSDSWRAYRAEELEKSGFKHKYNFVNPDNGTHTQNVERMWGSAKWRNKKHDLT